MVKENRSRRRRLDRLEELVEYAKELLIRKGRPRVEASFFEAISDEALRRFKVNLSTAADYGKTAGLDALSWYDDLNKNLTSGMPGS